MNTTNTLRRNTIFLIDDDPITNFIHTKIIQGCFSFTVTAFTNAMDALVELGKCQASGFHSMPALIFLDINMPHMDGWEFLDEVKKLSGELFKSYNVVMVTSSLDREDIERSKTYACVKEFISKPLTVQTIKDLVLLVGDNSFVAK